MFWSQTFWTLATPTRKLVRTASALGDWLAERKLSPADAGKAELWAYMATQRRTPAGRLPEGAVGLTRLPALLELMGILSKQPESPADSSLRRFEEHLANVRGVTPATQASYRHYVRPFVLGLCSGGAPDWSKMTSQYISEFVLRETVWHEPRKDGSCPQCARSFAS